MDNLYLCAQTAFSVWQLLRSMEQPRLDRLSPLPGGLGRLGLAPARVRTLRANGCKEPSASARAMGAVADLLGRATGIPARVRAGLMAELGALSRTPADFLVESCSERSFARDRRCHVWSAPVPAGAFASLGGGVFLATPELLFLQLARENELPALVLLGYEMCGAYALRRPGAGGAARCHPLTSVAQLRRFLDLVGPVRGTSLARRALRFIADESASPGETAMVFLVCLPRMLGGYGLPLPVMNYRLEVPARMRALVGGGFLQLDACWPEARLALEYDGAQFHSGAELVSRDRLRANRLELLGVSAIAIDKAIVFSAGRFDQAVRQVMRGIGYRPKAEAFDTGWHRRRDALRGQALGMLCGGAPERRPERPTGV